MSHGGARAPHVGVNLVPVAPERLVETAQRAEALGFESVWSGEHVALPFELQSKYPGGKPPFAADSIFLEPLLALAHLAAATTRIRLGVGIYLLPEGRTGLQLLRGAARDLLTPKRRQHARARGDRAHRHSRGLGSRQ